MPSPVYAMLRTLAALPLLVLGACAPRPPAGPSPPAGAPPSDLVILFGRSGGSAGQIQGHSVRADGSVLRWSGKYPEEHIQAEGRLEPNQVAALWDHIQAADFFAQQRQDLEPSAAFINVTAGGDSRRVTWSVPLGEEPPATPLQQLFDDLQEAVGTALDPSP